MNAKTRTVQVPGAPAAETVAEETVAVGGPVPEDSKPVEVPAIAEGDSDTVTVSKADLSALLTEVQSLRSEVKAAARRANPEAALPDQSEIDIATLKAPILTKQGWLVPEKFGSNPAAKVL